MNNRETHLSQLHSLDERLSGRIQLGEHRQFFRKIFSLISHSGDAIYLLIILGVIFALSESPWRFRALVIILVDFVTATLVQIIKFVFRRKRPEGEWGQVYRKHDPHSFPSGHSARGGAMGMIAILLGPWWFGLSLSIWGLLVASSRVLMSVHYLSDVLAGFILGTGISLVLYFVLF